MKLFLYKAIKDGKEIAIIIIIIIIIITIIIIIISLRPGNTALMSSEE